MFAFLPDAFLRVALYAGVIAAFFVAMGGIAGIILADRSDQALRLTAEELKSTRKSFTARTITPEQMQKLKESVDECWKGINIQYEDRSDAEVSNFAFSLELAFKDAGFEVFPYLLPTLQAGTGFDITIFMPRAAGTDWFEVVTRSKLYISLKGFGFTVGATNSAYNITKDEIITFEEEEKRRVAPDYCILMVHRQPPKYVAGPPYMMSRARKP